MKNSKLLVSLLLSLVLLLPCCGVKKKQLLSSVSKGMSKHEIEMKMGKPTETSRIKNEDGAETEIWDYRLATVDENQRGKRITVTVLSTIFFWPGLFALPFMDPKYSYDDYSVEFKNGRVIRWGKSIDLYLENTHRYLEN